MLKRIIISVTFLTSCGIQECPRQIDPYFEPFIERYKQDVKDNKAPLGDFDFITVMKIDHGSNPERHLAQCQVTTLKGRNEYISYVFPSATFYKKITFFDLALNEKDEIQYQIFLHEVGHCAYKFEHSQNANSIMYPTPIYNLNFQGLIRQFFDEVRDSHF